MDLQKLTIGQMAELNHVSQQTLRLYDREGLLKPLLTDRNTGYRYYHIIQSARLDFIQNMKLYGMTLREIRSLLENSDPESIKMTLESQIEKITDKIQQLQRSKTAIVRTIENYKKYEATPKNGEIFLEFMPQRKIFRYSCDINYFDQNEGGYEYMLRQLKKHMTLSNIPISYFTNTGTIIRKKDLLAGNMYSNEVFLFMDDWEDDERIETLPAATYVCLCSGDFSEEEDNVRRLVDYVYEHGFGIAGDYLCEVMVDFPILDSSARNICYKTQIPIENFGKY